MWLVLLIPLEKGVGLHPFCAWAVAKSPSLLDLFENGWFVDSYAQQPVIEETQNNEHNVNALVEDIWASFWIPDAFN